MSTRKPAYSTLVNALKAAICELEIFGHDGSHAYFPRSKRIDCRCCAVVLDLKKILKKAEK